MACRPDVVEAVREPEPEPLPRIKRPPKGEEPAQPAVRAVIGGGGEGAAGGDLSVGLVFDGVGGLHRRFFSEEAYLGTLGAGLRPCLAGDVTVRIRWEDEVRIGHITVEVTPEQLACRPTSGGAGLELSPLELSPLEPIGRAIAAYRDAVAAAFDFRVSSFRGELRMLGAETCMLRIGGQYPPDGSRWHPCAELGSGEVCVDDPADEGVQRMVLPPTDAARLEACFTP